MQPFFRRAASHDSVGIEAYYFFFTLIKDILCEIILIKIYIITLLQILF